MIVFSIRKKVMILYIRHRDPTLWINMVHSISELRGFEECYVPGSKVILGDLSQFSRPMLNKLLKLLEENPEIDCYSSSDMDDPVLLSRFTQVVKVPLEVTPIYSDDSFLNSDKSYLSVRLYLGLPSTSMLYASGRGKFGLSLLSTIK